MLKMANKFIPRSELRKLKTLRAYELATAKMAVLPDSSEGLEKLIDPAILRKIKVLRAYEIAAANITHPSLPSLDSSKKRYERPDINSYVKI